MKAPSAKGLEICSCECGYTLRTKRSRLCPLWLGLMVRVLQGLPSSPQSSVIRMPTATPHLLVRVRGGLTIGYLSEVAKPTYAPCALGQPLLPWVSLMFGVCRSAVLLGDGLMRLPTVRIIGREGSYPSGAPCGGFSLPLTLILYHISEQKSIGFGKKYCTKFEQFLAWKLCNLTNCV